MNRRRFLTVSAAAAVVAATATGSENSSENQPILLRIYLRGGQTIEKVVTDWGVKKSDITGNLLEFSWTNDPDAERMPWIRCDAIDAITRHDVGPAEGAP